MSVLHEIFRLIIILIIFSDSAQGDEGTKQTTYTNEGGDTRKFDPWP